MSPLLPQHRGQLINVIRLTDIGHRDQPDKANQTFAARMSPCCLPLDARYAPLDTSSQGLQRL